MVSAPKHEFVRVVWLQSKEIRNMLGKLRAVFPVVANFKFWKKITWVGKRQNKESGNSRPGRRVCRWGSTGENDSCEWIKMVGERFNCEEPLKPRLTMEGAARPRRTFNVQSTVCLQVRNWSFRWMKSRMRFWLYYVTGISTGRIILKYVRCLIFLFKILSVQLRPELLEPKWLS